jgi:hypothetical protein
MVKKKDDSNLLPKFKKHSQFKRYGILKIQKFKIFFKIFKFQKSFTTCKWGVMSWHTKQKLYFMI